MHATRPTLTASQRKTNVSVFWERGIQGRGGWRRGCGEGDVDGGNGGEKIEKGIERDERAKQRRGEDRDGERQRHNEGREGGE